MVSSPACVPTALSRPRRWKAQGEGGASLPRRIEGDVRLIERGRHFCSDEKLCAHHKRHLKSILLSEEYSSFVASATADANDRTRSECFIAAWMASLSSNLPFEIIDPKNILPSPSVSRQRRRCAETSARSPLRPLPTRRSACDPHSCSFYIVKKQTKTNEKSDNTRIS